LEVPPLRQRLADLPGITQALHGRVCARLGLPVDGSRPWVELLLAQAPHHAWPGNVRELENILERLLVASVLPGQQADRTALQRLAPELFDTVASSRPAALAWVPPSAPGSARRVPPSDADITRALQDHQGDRQAAADALGISRTTLWRRLRALG